MAQTKIAQRVPEDEENPRWFRAEVSGLPVVAWIAISVAIVASVLGVGSWWTYGRGGRVPPVQGFYAGKSVSFIHTEASDPSVARRLTGMKASPVLAVPELADVPASSLAKVYVFRNGVRGGGPFGFQPDVFDSAPGDPGYRPLRALELVTWNPAAKAEVLRSAPEIEAAAARGAIKIENSGVVVNMPFITWPRGRR
jgi:hypothetical protein